MIAILNSAARVTRARNLEFLLYLRFFERKQFFFFFHSREMSLCFLYNRIVLRVSGQLLFNTDIYRVSVQNHALLTPK